jgi:DNA-binding NarL/FixJ family response regulator
MIELIENMLNQKPPGRTEGVLLRNATAAAILKQKKKHNVRLSVAIVEGDKLTRGMLADWIGRTDNFHCAGMHGNGESALTGLPLESPKMILMDINLPDMNGIDCLRRLKPLLPDTQFVMLTLSEEPNHIFSAFAAGVSGYLLKRISRLELLAALKKIHAGGLSANGEIARKVLHSFQRSGLGSSDSENLSPRQQEVLELLAHGHRYEQIAGLLHVSMATATTHIRRIYKKLRVHSRAQAVAVYAQYIHSDKI